MLRHFPRSLINVSSQVLGRERAREEGQVLKGKSKVEEIDEEKSRNWGDVSMDQDREKEIEGDQIIRATSQPSNPTNSSPPTPTEKALTINSIQLCLLNSGPVVGARSTMAAVCCAVLRESEVRKERGVGAWRAGEEERGGGEGGDR